jgi:thiol-disulfide isomerase/thioredoxin
MKITKYILALTITYITTMSLQAQTQNTWYDTSTDASNKSKVLKGIINPAVLQAEPSFTWLTDNAKNYTPNAETVAALKSQSQNIHLVVFGGTWCGDTKDLLPKFLKWLKAANWPEEKLTLIGVDREKTTKGNLTQAFGITNVPTFIVLQNGKELGRIVEYGTNGGQTDKAIIELLQKK